MAFGREIGMEFERVKVSPEMVGIASGGVAILAFMLALFVLIWNLGQNIGDLRTDMSDLRTELKGEIATLRTEVFGEIANLNERMAHIEGLLEGYIERSRTGDGVAATE
ncbi:MAG: hypothetical protein OXC38_08705 [Gammaproteobacteria bacterium]|nr:hypothetical protein [Gammaproteobacteria bacterium]